MLSRLGASAPLRATGALTLVAPESGELPVAERMLTPDVLLVSLVLGTDLAAIEPPAGVRHVASRRLGPWPAGLLDRLRGCAADAAAGARAGARRHRPRRRAGARGGGGRRWRGSCSCALAAWATGRCSPHARLRARLQGALVAVASGDEPLSGDEREALTESLARADGPAVLAGAAVVAAVRAAGVPVHVIAIPPLTLGERTDAWVAQLPADAHGHAAAVAARFPLAREQIADACVLAAAQAREERLAAPARHHLVTAGQALAGTAMGGLARRLEAGWDWDDLVLAPGDVATLRSIAAYLRHRETVLDGWGFGALGSGDGLTVMFCGPSGTGKTMAAQVIANDLGLEAFHVDVSAIVSKYIGETEKNLEQLFAAATDTGALMVFDEADALFGKRSAVTDARDRYANLEVSYLLQRIESHPGASILTTNMRQNIDQAFLRRMDFIVDFPLPGEAERLAIWRRHLPAGAPVADDLDLADARARARASRRIDPQLPARGGVRGGR